MKHLSFFILLAFSFLFPSCDDDPIEKKEEKPPFRYETIVGNTYVLSDLTSPVEYVFYTFNEDSTIDIETRERYLDGELLGKSVGYYEYNHPILKLKVNSGCDNCFNNFEAKVSDYRRDFTIKMWSGFDDTFFVYDSYYDTKYQLKPKN